MCTPTWTALRPEDMPDGGSGVRFRGIAYRAHNPQWAWTPLSGEGARRHGGRFNKRGVPALYLSLSQMTAIREATPLGRPMQPLTLCAYEVDAEPILHAGDPSQRRANGIRQADLACPTWEADMLDGGVAMSQRLADVLVDAGYVGMLARSFAVGATEDDLNLVMWRWSDTYPARVTVVDEHDRLFRPP